MDEEADDGVGGGGAPAVSRKMMASAWLTASTVAGTDVQQLAMEKGGRATRNSTKERDCYPHRQNVEQLRGSEGGAHRVQWSSRSPRALELLSVDGRC